MSMGLHKSCYWHIYTKYVLFLWIYNLHIWDIPLFSDTSQCYCELCTEYSSKYRSWIPVSARLHFETNYVIISSVCNLRITWRYLIAQIKYENNGKRGNNPKYYLLIWQQHHWKIKEVISLDVRTNLW